MKGFLNSILNAGSQSDLPEYLLRKVKITNVVALIVFFTIGLPFMVISAIHVPGLVHIPVLGTITALIVIVVNALGGIKYSRIFTSVALVYLVVAYNGYLSTPGEPMISSLFAIAMSFLLSTFLLFDIRERTLLVLSTLLGSLAILTFPLQSQWYVIDHNPSQVAAFVTLLKTGWVGQLSYVLAIGLAVGSIYTLAVINQKAENKNEVLREEAEQQKEKLRHEKIEREKDIEQLRKSQQEEQKRQWVSEGVSLVFNLLSKEQDAQARYDQLVSSIVKYIEANQAGLYIADDTKGAIAIRLAACYAYNRKKYLEKNFEPGEGLLGQAYLEKQTAYITELPKEYITITSGLGEAPPNKLLIVPLVDGEHVEGLLEIASFHLFQEHQIDLIERLAGRLASFLRNEKTATQTRALLIQAQQQTEELQAAEEEMRQNQEELQAIQEQLTRENHAIQEKFEVRERELLTETEQLQQEIERLKQLVSTSTTS